MKTSKTLFILTCVLVMGILVACAELLDDIGDFIDTLPDPETTPTPGPEETPTPTETPLPTVTPEPTETPEIPTPTPTATPVPLPDNVFFIGFDQAETRYGKVKDGVYTTESRWWYAHWEIPTTASGYIEFTAKGFQQDELYGGTEFKSVLVSMWSGEDGYDYANAPYIFEIRKYGFIKDRPDASNAFKAKIKSRGEWEESGYVTRDWDPEKEYHFRIEWGNSTVLVFRDGEHVLTGQYNGPFAPTKHQIQLGANPRRYAPKGLVISNVIIGKK
jgi:hypothetical protein